MKDHNVVYLIQLVVNKVKFINQVITERIKIIKGFKIVMGQ